MGGTVDGGNMALRQFCRNFFAPKRIGFVLCFFLLYVTINVRLNYHNGNYTKVKNKFAILARRPSSDCGLSFQSKMSRKPIFKLDPHRFILPFFINGPTNQMIGLRDTVYLAILLNRTVILPRFFKHSTDSTGAGESVDIRMRVDVEELTSLVSVVPYTEVEQTCSRRFDVTFIARHHNCRDVTVDDEKLDELNLTLGRKDNGNYNLVYCIDQVMNDPTPQDFAAYYASDARCVMAYWPYRFVVVREGQNTMAQATQALTMVRKGNLETVRNQPHLLYSLIYAKIHRPKFVAEIAANFASRVMGTVKYLAVHWRFDPDDWLHKCDIVVEDRTGVCKQIYSITGTDVINAAVKQAEERLDGETKLVVYFATPLNQKDFLLEVQKAVRKLRRQGKRLRLLTSADVLDHLREYAGCPDLAGLEEDVLSLVEMQLCVMATSFMHSPYSSWSLEVAHQRGKQDTEILSAAWKMHDVTKQKETVKS